MVYRDRAYGLDVSDNSSQFEIWFGTRTTTGQMGRGSDKLGRRGLNGMTDPKLSLEMRSEAMTLQRRLLFNGYFTNRMHQTSSGVSYNNRGHLRRRLSRPRQERMSLLE
ncbi:hypothetical protein PM082_020343 [Marasmius tenuissimus]|nr:hypothetical protein PM082_020343 [Marasmius tenuissimus]